ncbi:MAG TPA: rod shape-determining protein MreD [Thermomicrobiales bacterium]
MARFLFALILLATAIVQATILPAANLLAIQPDATLVLLLVWSALRGVPEGLAWAFGLGLVLDVLAMDPLGANGLALLGVVLLGGVARRRFFQSTLIVPIVVAAVATLLHAVVLLLVRSGSGEPLPISSVIHLVVLQALLNSIFVPPLYLVAGIMDRRMVARHAI